ncbi:mucin-like protein [Phytophthora cinnamomi]|uniref:mucin-like protein n=1 Tax=Phytophthora cinnamomi TaxID=4785 RepID=UPI00355A16CF|nr:mucin-like protein [Phytophthora cinnamomi]
MRNAVYILKCAEIPHGSHSEDITGALSNDEQALNMEVTDVSIADGTVVEFAGIATDTLGQAQCEYSCSFFSWHRRLLLAFP